MDQRRDDISRQHSIAMASFKILDVEVVGHVLADGTRIVEAECIEKLMIAMASPDRGGRVDLMELQRFKDWQEGRTPA